MPKLDGISVTRLLKSDLELRARRIISWTAYPHESIESGALEAGADIVLDEAVPTRISRSPRPRTVGANTGQLAGRGRGQPRHDRGRRAAAQRGGALEELRAFRRARIRRAEGRDPGPAPARAHLVRGR